MTTVKNDVLNLVRTAQTCQSWDGSVKATGCRGKLTVPGRAVPLHTIERADGYVSLPPGTYDCKTTRRAKNGKPCIHITHSVRNDKGNLARILMHVANKPHEITGCIAVGMSPSKQGVSRSEDALKEIFEAVGASDTQLGHSTTISAVFKLVVNGRI